MATQVWCRARVVDGAGRVLSSYVLSGVGDPTMSAVDTVAGLALDARRLGGDLVVTEVSPRLQELIDLAGLPIAPAR